MRAKFLLDEQRELHDRHGVQAGGEEVGINAEVRAGFDQVGADAGEEAFGDWADVVLHGEGGMNWRKVS